MQKILLVDTYNMIHRARFGWASGDHSITFTFFRSLRSEIERHKPDKVYIVSEGRPVHREKINPDYKANRAPLKDPDFHRQKRDIFELCKLLPVTVIKHPEFECDDVIGHLAEVTHKTDEVVICSSDSDFIQLIEDDRVFLWNPVKKKFVEKWPVDYVLWKSLRGDKTDNVPGIKGVGDKTAFKLASDQVLLENFLTPEKRKIFESAMTQIKLASLEKEGEKIDEKDYSFDEASLKNAFTTRQFKSIIEKSWPKWQNSLESLNAKRTAKAE